MNRSILIVICDFLLVSLLVFSTPDVNKLANPSNEPQTRPLVVTNRPDVRQDLATVMQLALEEERKGREKLQSQLTQNSQQFEQQQSLLSQREKQVQIFQQEKSNLERQYAAAQTNLQTLNQQLQSTTTDALAARDRALSIEAALRHQEDLAAALRKSVVELAQSNQNAQSEKQQLTTQLQVSEAEKRAANQQLARAQDEVKVERQERAKLADNVQSLANKSGELAEGVKTLAARSGDLTQEIREHRPLAANSVFNEFTTNRVHATFFGSRSGIFGIETNKRRETEMVLMTDGTNTFAVCHLAETPVVFTPPGNEWSSLTGSLTRKQAVLPISLISFSRSDPRIVLIPLTAAQSRELDCRVYRTSSDPFKFQDAIVIGAIEGYYGECKFQIDVSTPYYVKMDRNFLKGLFGKFNPSRGDLVFSKSGELLGIMANSTYCFVLQHCEPATILQLGEDIRGQHTEKVLSSLNDVITNLPTKLQ